MPEKNVLSIQPLSNLVLVLPDPKEQWLKPDQAKIIRPDQSSLLIPTGIVLSVGPGLNTAASVMPMHVKPGDRVIIDTRSAQVVIHEGHECLLMHENDIVGKVVIRIVNDPEAVVLNQISLN